MIYKIYSGDKLIGETQSYDKAISLYENGGDKIVYCAHLGSTFIVKERK